MPIPEPDVSVAEGNVEKGAKIFKTKCAQCHNADQVRLVLCESCVLLSSPQ